MSPFIELLFSAAAFLLSVRLEQRQEDADPIA